MTSNSSSPPIPPTGLTVVAEAAEPKADIVLIHGFTGHPETTWRYTKASAPPDREGQDTAGFGGAPAAVRGLTILSRSSTKGSTHDPAPVYWPRDLLPWTESQLRIMTYGYDTHIRHWIGSQPVNRTTVYDISWDFLVALESARRKEPKRPIVFIAHSLGGIIAKEMLRRSKGCQLGQAHLHDIFQSTVGIIFFGTPHAGADPRGLLQRMAERLIKAAGFSANEQIVSTLLPSAERLRELRDEFGPMAQQQRWVIHSFQESLGVKFLSNNKVVEDTSSCLHIPSVETTEHIGRNHMDMCRFTGSEDVEYKKVASALQRILATPPRSSPQTPTPQFGGFPTTEQKQLLKSSLRFDQLDARHMNIRKAHTNTCVWLPVSPEYRSWLDPVRFSEHQGFLWIKGKPGVGKSTLIKFALNNYRRSKPHDTVILSFFFNARGHDLERSTLGLYRSLLLQLLERVPSLLDVLDGLDCATFDEKSHDWSIESLKELFEEAVLSLESSSVTCFIDALDECDEAEIRDMLSLFECIGRQSRDRAAKFRVCLTSRHYPHITLKKGLVLVLEQQSGHKGDIARFLRTELRIDDSTPAMEIRHELQKRCSGVFMWVVLVVGILNKLHDQGRSVPRLKESLNEIPHDLHHLFNEILTLNDENQDEVSLCMQWILFSHRPLKPQELYFAIQARAPPDDPETLMDWDSDVVSVDAIKKFILNSSKGLAEITRSQIPVVQFIHESVRDFLLKDGLKNILPGDTGDTIEGRTHNSLAQCCLNYIRSGASDPVMQNICDGIQELPPESAEVQRQLALSVYPFMEYAVQHILLHADAAEARGMAQLALLEDFPREGWIRFHNTFEPDSARRYPSTTSALYILAENNLSNLVQIHPSISHCFSIEEARYGTPMLAAIAKEHRQTAQAMLKALVDTQHSSPAVHQLYAEFSQKYTLRGYKFAYDSYRLRNRNDIVHLLKQKEEYDLLALLLLLVPYDLTELPQTNKNESSEPPPLFHCRAENSEDGIVVGLLKHTANGPTSLEAIRVGNRWLRLNATTQGYYQLGQVVRTNNVSAVKLLLETEAMSHSATRGPVVEEAVIAAVYQHNEEIVRLLVETFAGFADPLVSTIRRHSVADVEALLDIGYSANGLFNGRDTPLKAAVRIGDESVVRLLLAKGADPDGQDEWDSTPLELAILYGRADIVETLLEGGASCVSELDTDKSSLRQAMARTSEPIVRLLLKQGMKGLPTPSLFTAIYDGNYELLDRLLDQGADVGLRDVMGRTPLHYALSLNDMASTKKLLRRDVNPWAFGREWYVSGTGVFNRVLEKGRIGELSLGLLEETSTGGLIDQLVGSNNN